MQDPNETIDIQSITDIKELKVLMADQFIKEKNAIEAQREANQGIQLINARIVELLAATPEPPKSPKGSAANVPPQEPVGPPAKNNDKVENRDDPETTTIETTMIA